MACCPYRSYYLNQAGGSSSLPVFRGSPYQKGHGLGSLFSSLARFAVPLLKRGAKYLGRRALQTGVDIARDVMEDKKDWRAATKHRLKSTANTIMDDVEEKIRRQQGGANKKLYKKRKRLSATTKKKKKKSKRVKRQKQIDIFDDGIPSSSKLRMY